MSNACMNIQEQAFVGLIFHFSGYLLKQGTDGSYGNSMSNFLNTANLFPKWLSTLHYSLSTSSQSFVVVCVL
jgi:hypothetical protein